VTKFLFVTDLDNTLVGDDKALLELNERLAKHRQEYGTKIVYATGRSPLLYRKLATEKHLLRSDALVLSVGTEIYLDGSEIPDEEWSQILAPGWDRAAILSVTKHFSDLIEQPESEQRPFKISFFLQEDKSDILTQLTAELEKLNLHVKLIYSSGEDLDILPRNSDKGQAMKFLQKKWGFTSEKTVVCGDSGNDIALFAVGNERGIIVGNARSELLVWLDQYPSDYRYLAREFYAGGINEGLQHFGFLS
jgi:sucrose-6F-phosphate phosphohydrolase